MFFSEFNPAHLRLWARPRAGSQVYSPFRWSLLLGVEGPRVPVALFPGGVEWSASVCDLSTALPFVMVAHMAARQGGGGSERMFEAFCVKSVQR